MGSKVLLVLVMFMATILLISSEIAPKHLDEKFDKNDGNKHAGNGLEDSKYWGYSGYGWYGRPWYGWRGDYGGPWYGWRGNYGGPWYGWGGGWRRGYGPRGHAEANVDAQPHN